MTTFLTLVGELRSAIDREARANEQFEHFIATCDPKTVGSLPEALNECRRATERLAEVYELLRDLMPYEDEVRAMAARGAVRSDNETPAVVTVISRDDRTLEGRQSAAV